MRRGRGGLKTGQLTLVPLVLTLFCLVSGGPHGLENATKEAGPGMALLLVLVLPLLWAWPVALMTAELTSAIPEEGGYYAWSKRALGKFWGFQCGWWTWLYSMADAAIYPVLFTSYTAAVLKMWTGSDLLASDTPTGVLLRLLIAALMIGFFSWLNIRGIKLVGRASVFLGLFVMAPFAAMVLIAFVRGWPQPLPQIQHFVAPDTDTIGAFAAGMYIVMWNYLGWDTLSTVTEEVERPERTFPRALLITIPIVSLAYILPVLAGLRFFPDYQLWEEGAWPLIAQAIGGDWLGNWVSLAALASPIALFVTAVLGASRVPFVLAEDGYFPSPLLRTHPRFGTPHVSIIFCALIYLGLTTYFSFAELVELNVTLYVLSLLPELAALLVLRIKEPNLPRPYRIPGGLPGVLLVVIAPILVSAVAFWASWMDPAEGWQDQLPVLALILSGPIVYGMLRSKRPLQQEEASDAEL
ncbi:MAG TPA: APC family permease [Fimbriimonadaceae bacterium]|nr:APC family permease [Fimbriimonadaceae bacterium]